MVRVYLVMTSLLLLFLFGCWLGFACYWDYLRFPLPEYTGIDVMYWAEDQNWTDEQRQEFYHKTQGTTLAPLKWLQALEQPKLLGWGPAPPFLSHAYLAQLRILPDPNRTDNPEGLPVGLAVQRNFVDYNDDFRLNTPDQRNMVGMNCAFCHTAQLNYRGVGVRIDGGPSHVDVDRLQTELGYAVVLTLVLRSRRDRFAEQVLGKGYTKQQKHDLEIDLFTTFRKLLVIKKINAFYPTKEGPGRLDALGRIGNFVFGYDTGDTDNLRVGDAPVHFPHIWDTGWFDWVQYNGSIRQPMMRNVSEALGVYASIALDSFEDMEHSSVPIQNLYEIEKLLFGDSPYTGLRSPKWPEGVLGKINQGSAEAGRGLYLRHCQHCHLPPIDDVLFWKEENWERLDAEKQLGLRLLKTVLVPALCDETTWGDKESSGDEVKWKDYGRWPRPRTAPCIGTDAHVVRHWEERTAVVSELNSGRPIEAGVGLAAVSKRIADEYYRDNKFSQEKIDQYNGYRSDEVRKPLGYRARPLNGVWATAPFLHNGSVPSLYELLSPADERSTTFYTGSREFDPQKVGFSTEKFRGGFLFDTRANGNSNAGHEFKGTTLEDGVIGAELTEAERYAIIEYIKTLSGNPGDARPAPAPTDAPTGSDVGDVRVEAGVPESETATPPRPNR